MRFIKSIFLLSCGFLAVSAFADINVQIAYLANFHTAAVKDIEYSVCNSDGVCAGTGQPGDPYISLADHLGKSPVVDSAGVENVKPSVFANPTFYSPVNPSSAGPSLTFVIKTVTMSDGHVYTNNTCNFFGDSSAASTGIDLHVVNSGTKSFLICTPQDAVAG